MVQTVVAHRQHSLIGTAEIVVLPEKYARDNLVSTEQSPPSRCHSGWAKNVSGLLITTEAMVAERPKKETPMPAMPGGGMGGMDY
jgi:hypothetical protein